MDDQAMDGDMRKKQDKIRKQYGMKEQPKAGQWRQSANVPGQIIGT